MADETGAGAEETAVTAAEAPGTAPDTSGTPAETAETAKTAEATETAEAAEAAGTAGAAAGAGRIRLAAIVLGVVTVVLAGFGVWATLAAHNLRAGAAPQNVAVTDLPATTAVRQQIARAVDTVFSYSYANTAATRRAAQSLLTGAAIHQYDTYFQLVTRDAPAQKLVVTTRVTNSGVELLTGSQARLLVFANQQDTRAGTKQTSYAGALFAVTAVRQGGRWKIENIDTFNGQ